jgi:hypothetical protein
VLANTNKISNYSIVGGITSLLFLLIVESELPLLLLWLLFMLLGNVFYHDQTERNLFRINLNISLIFLPFFLWSYVLQTGKPFIPGGDSEVYYNNFMHAVDTGRLPISSRERYVLYYIVSWKYYVIIKFITGSTSYLYLVFLTLFISSHTAPLLYKIGSNENFKKKVVLSACLMTCFFPSLLQTNIAILREGFIVAPFLFSMYLSQKIKKSEKNSATIKYIILFLLTLLWIANIRFEVGGIALLFFVIYNYIFIDKPSVKSYIFLGVLIVLAVVFVLPNVVGLQLTEYYNLNSKREHFDSVSLTQVDSLTASLRQQGFIGRFILFFYCFFQPIPPHLFANITIPHYYLLAVGNILWYFMLPISVIEIFKNIKQKTYSGFSKSFLIASIAVVFMLSLTLLGTERHKIYIYPVMFLFFFNYLDSYSKERTSRTFMGIAILFTLVITIYLAAKIF